MFKELIESEIIKPKIQELINDEAYYFQKLTDVKDKFLNYQITVAQIEKIIEDYEAFDNGTFEEFVINSNNSIKPFLEILAEYISYLDTKASGKNRWNKYPDKRSIAKAFVRMPHWVKNLLKLKLNPNDQVATSVKNAFNYSVSPINNLTCLSENHREALSKFILNKPFDEFSFQDEIIDYFKPFGITPKNKLNYTYIISSILYSPQIKSIWIPKEEEEIDVNENNENMSEHEFFESYKEYLMTHRKGEIGLKTMEGYHESAMYHSPRFMKKHNINYEEVLKFNKVELKLLKEELDNTQSGFSGITSFRNFINFLLFDVQPLNQIFYGPPGTGKTYKILSEYMNSDNIIEEKADDSKIYINEKSKFWHLAPGQFGYLWGQLKSQDFLGYEWCEKNLGDLKKLDKNVESFDMKSRFSKVKVGDYFCIISGKKFYAIAEALHDYDFDLSLKSEFDFQTVKVNWLKQFDKPQLLNTSSTQSFSNLNGSKRWNSLLEALENEDIYFHNKKGETLKKIEKNYSLVSFHQSFSYEDFIEGIKPDLNKNDEDYDKEELSYIIQDGIFKTACDKAANIAGYEDLQACLNDSRENRERMLSKAKPYYLLIDEINRGNISSIFGELITLLEDDKRLGGKNELTIDLPYSKKSFGVPNNLFLIGTMNTADRSVESLDTALRRRFSFIEIPPDSNALKEAHPYAGIIESNGEKINLIKILDTINDRIEILINKDHKIGHSYFFNVLNLEDLRKTFKDKVAPLLEEYFYGDFGKIGLILGNAFISVNNKEKKTKLADFEHEDREALSEKKLYNFTQPKDWTPESFKSIYSKI